QTQTWCIRHEAIRYRLAAPLLRYLLFFFSSRRRHTRFSRDWSSDVCSSDLSEKLSLSRTQAYCRLMSMPVRPWPPAATTRSRAKIGRASCRERVSRSADAASVKNKKLDCDRTEGAFRRWGR